MIMRHHLTHLTALLLAAFTTSRAAEFNPVEQADGSWLPASPAPAHQPDADAYRKSLSGTIRPLVCRYEGTRLVSTAPPTGAWGCELHTTTDADGSMDLAVTFTLKEGAAKSAGVAVAFDFADWTTDNYVLVPATLYGGIRFRVLPLSYPPFIHNPQDRPLDMPVTVTDIPRLRPDGARQGRADDRQLRHADDELLQSRNPARLHAARRAGHTLRQQRSVRGRGCHAGADDFCGRRALRPHSLGHSLGPCGGTA
jgi:hypothetical protein